MGEKHRLRSIREGASSPGINPHLVPVFHSGVANPLIRDQDAKAERLIPAPFLKFRSIDLNETCKRPRYTNVTSITSRVTACSQAGFSVFGGVWFGCFWVFLLKTDNYSAVFITKTAKPAVLSYWISQWPYRIEIQQQIYKYP